MAICIGNDLEDSLKALEMENASLKRYNGYHQVVHEIEHISHLHVDTSSLEKINMFHYMQKAWNQCGISVES